MSTSRNKDPVWINFDRVVNQTPKAVLYSDGDGTFWVPRSLIVDSNDRQVCIEAWFVEREGIKGSRSKGQRE